MNGYVGLPAHHYDCPPTAAIFVFWGGPDACTDLDHLGHSGRDHRDAGVTLAEGSPAGYADRPTDRHGRLPVDATGTPAHESTSVTS